MLGWFVCVAMLNAGPAETPTPEPSGRRAWPIELRSITVEAELAALTVRFGAQHPETLAAKARLERLEDAKREAPTEDGADQAMLAGELHLLDAKLADELKKLKAKLGDKHTDVVAITRQREVIARHERTLPALELKAESGAPAVARAVVEEAIASARINYFLRTELGAKHPEIRVAEERLADAARIIARSRVSANDRESIDAALMQAIHQRLGVMHDARADRDNALVDAELDGLAIAHARLAVRRFAGDLP